MKKRKIFLAAISVLIALCCAAIYIQRAPAPPRFQKIESDLDARMEFFIKRNEDFRGSRLTAEDFIAELNSRRPAIEKAIASLRSDMGGARSDRERKRILKKAYLALNYNLACYHCGRAIAYSPQGKKDNLCFSAITRDIKDDYYRGEKRKNARRRVKYPKNIEYTKRIIQQRLGADKRPTIVIIVIDAFRQDYAYDRKLAPFLNSLGDRGFRFDNAMSSGPATHISVASLLTGAPPFRHRLLSYGEWENELIFAPLLRLTGYRTIGFSANSVVKDSTGFAVGFNSFRDRFWPPADIMNNEIFLYLDAEYDSKVPHFFYIHYIDPHGPYFSPDKFNEKTNFRVSAMEAVNPDIAYKDYTLKNIDMRSVESKLAVGEMKEMYAEEVKYMDRKLKELFEGFEKRGLAKNTIFIITSDHGEEFLDHGSVKHSRTLYNELIHVPLIVCGRTPDSWKGKSVKNRPVSNIDIAPTVLELAGARRPRSITGTHLFMGPPAPQRFAVANGSTPGELNENCVSGTIMEGDWKLIACPDRGKSQLFNIKDDPRETTSVAGANPALAKRLFDDYLQWKASTESTSVKPLKKASPETMKQLKSLGYVK